MATHALEERQPGQLGAQLNMLSDPVSGIRRRPPGDNLIGNPGLDSLFTEYVERGTDGRHLLINTSNGNWWLLAKNGKTILNSGNDPYFVTTVGQTSLQTASIAGLTYIAPTSTPAPPGSSTLNPQHSRNAGTSPLPLQGCW